MWQKPFYPVVQMKIKHKFIVAYLSKGSPCCIEVQQGLPLGFKVKRHIL